MNPAPQDPIELQEMQGHIDLLTSLAQQAGRIAFSHPTSKEEAVMKCNELLRLANEYFSGQSKSIAIKKHTLLSPETTLTDEEMGANFDNAAKQPHEQLIALITQLNTPSNSDDESIFIYQSIQSLCNDFYTSQQFFKSISMDWLFSN